MSAPVPEELAATLTARQAAELLNVKVNTIHVLASRGVLHAVKVSRHWLLSSESVEYYKLTRRQGGHSGRPTLARVPAAPLLRQVMLRGGPAACGVEQHSAEEKALERAQEEGALTRDVADLLSVRLLALPPVLLWGDDWLV